MSLHQARAVLIKIVIEVAIPADERIRRLCADRPGQGYGKRNGVEQARNARLRSSRSLQSVGEDALRAKLSSNRGRNTNTIGHRGGGLARHEPTWQQTPAVARTPRSSTRRFCQSPIRGCIKLRGSTPTSDS